tara:strand:- start:53 stop:187 length:135 start_codon:yes stop_codon:yes gene_type:complete
MEKLTKEEIIGDLLMNGHIDAEEAITLLSENDECLAFDYTITTT